MKQGVKTEIFMCLQYIGNILVLGRFTGAHFITHIDVTLFFCMYQIHLKNKSKL